MAVRAGRRWPLSRLLHLPLVGDTLEHRERRRLARAVRKQAHTEREHSHRAGVIEFDSIAVRTALYEAIARRLEDAERPVATSGLDELKTLLAEPAPVRDYGRPAQARNEHIADVLNELDSGEVTDAATA